MWKWTLNIDNKTTPKQEVTLSGDYSINEKLGGSGESYRLMVLNEGYIDIVDCSKGGDVAHSYDINFNGVLFKKFITGLGDIIIELIINNDKTFSINQDGNLLTGSLTPYPKVDIKDINSFNWMLDNKYIPYQNIPDEPGKTTAKIKELGVQYFPFTASSFELAMSIYDWTTADFTRIDFFRIFVYTDVLGEPLDLNSIAQSIWTANWPPYTPQDPYYMNSFMMKPSNSLEEVTSQLNEKAESLRIHNNSEINIIEASLKGMPRTSIIKTPKLYSGQVSISNLGLQHFATYFKEFPYNSMIGNPLEMPLEEALDTFIQVQKTLTLKSPMSFTDSLDDAMHYSNGIVLAVDPIKGSMYWNNATYITPLSDGPEKTEYLFHPNTKFRINEIENKKIDDKNITVIYLQEE